MGTSSDYGGGRGGAWTPFKIAATNYAKHGGRGNGARVVARHVATLGGAAGATRSARAGIAGAANFAGLLAGIARNGLTPTLREAGLGDLVGRDRFDVVQALIDLVAGAGSDLEEQAAREAALDVIDELFADAADYDELAALTLDADGLVRALEAFLAYYIYNRLRQQIDERLTRHADPARAEQLDGDLRQLIRAQVRIRLREVDPLTVDWSDSEGRVIIESALRSAYGVLEDLEE
jgi:hypothetical protein